MTTSVKPTLFEDLDDYLADIGDRIRAERQARRWSQAELGRRAGMGLVQVKRLENGDTTSFRGFVLACSALGVTADHLLSQRWRMPASSPSLTRRQTEVLRTVADGRPLSVAAGELAMTPEGLASVLSGIYRRLGVADVRRDQRRAAAVRVAADHGLFDAA